MDNMQETLVDAISEACAKADSPWLVIAGDWNRYDLSCIADSYPNLSMVETPPTRGDALLDYSFTNFPVDKAEVSFPVESDNSKADHAIINYECMLERPASFAWETHEYIKLTDQGVKEFSERIKMQDWSQVKKWART